MKYLLDTNICVHFLRGKFEVDKTIKLKGLISPLLTPTLNLYNNK